MANPQTLGKLSERMEANRTSAVNMLLAIKSDSEWREVLDCLELAKAAIERAAEFTQEAIIEDEA